jgi:prevent-host-death family protein
MESMCASKFKATCLAVLDEVARQKTRIIITKRGRPIAEVIPYELEAERLPLKDTVTFLDDLVSPVAGEDWEVMK